MPLPLPSAHDRLQARYFLTSARALIERDGTWKPGWYFAEKPDGELVDPRDRYARRFSTTAALRCAGAKVSGFTALLAVPFLDFAAGEPVDDYECGAGRTQAEMLAVFDHAIAALSEPGDGDLEDGVLPSTLAPLPFTGTNGTAPARAAA